MGPFGCIDENHDNNMVNFTQVAGEWTVTHDAIKLWDGSDDEQQVHENYFYIYGKPSPSYIVKVVSFTLTNSSITDGQFWGPNPKVIVGNKLPNKNNIDVFASRKKSRKVASAFKEGLYDHHDNVEARIIATYGYIDTGKPAEMNFYVEGDLELEIEDDFFVKFSGIRIGQGNTGGNNIWYVR